MLEEVRPNESTDEQRFPCREGRHFLNKWISSDNKVYRLDEVVFRDDYGNQLLTNDPVSIDLVIQMYVTGQNNEENIFEQLYLRGQELFGKDTNWEFEVNETEVVCLV